MSQPHIDREKNDGTDTDGRQWVQALVDARGRILAGRDKLLNFHLFVSPEELFDHAMASIYSARGIDIPAMLKETENGAQT